jgi:hypothetical protein
VGKSGFRKTGGRIMYHGGYTDAEVGGYIKKIDEMIEKFSEENK